MSLRAIHAVHAERYLTETGRGWFSGGSEWDGFCADELCLETAVVDGVDDGGDKGVVLDTDGGVVAEETDDHVGDAGETGEHFCDGGGA